MKEKINMSSRQCEHPTKSGARCRANSVNGSTKCWSHEPALAAKATAARRRGGENKRRAVLGSDWPAISLCKGSDAPDLARRILVSVLHGEVDPKISNSAVGLLNFWLRAYTTEVLERRIVALEAAHNTGPQLAPDRLEGAEQFGARGAQL